MENYEQKYKEALKVMEGLYNVVKYQLSSDALLTSQTIEKAFHELKESEDERIRKEIIEFLIWLKEFRNGGYEPSGKYVIEDMIAWLEKQANIPYFTFDDILALQCAMKATEKADNELYEQLKSLHDRLHDVYWLEKQGEHKCDCKYTGCHINDMKRWCHKKQSEIPYEKCNTKCSEYLNDGEKKPAWSEEDDSMIEGIKIAILDYYDKENADEIISWLESIKDRVQPQPKQEWSEEDKDVIKHLLSICNGAKNYNQFAGCSQNDITKYQDWLKSLKPRWKPTEEQIKALRWVLNSIPYNQSKEEISGLLEQLKNFES